MDTDNAYHSQLWQTGFSAAALLAGGALHLNGMGERGDWIWLAGMCVVLLAAVIEIIRAALRRQLGLDLIALVSIGGAIALHEYLAGAVIALMFASGRALENFAEHRARKEMSALLERAPRLANRYDGSAIVQISLESVQPGDRLLVRAGETVPVDGRLLSDAATLDESSLTGESMPVPRTLGQTLASGTINAGDAFDLHATQTAENSTFTSVIRLVEAAQHSKAPASRMADRYALIFVPLSLAIAGLAWLLSGDPVRALAVVVVATPCPLILAVPVAIVSAMSRSAQHGVLVKHGGALEKLAQVKTMFFDKTGTLTGGTAKLVSVKTDASLPQDEVLRLAASLEQMSGHVIAQAVVSAVRERGLELSVPTEVVEKPGAGLSGRVDGKQVDVGAYDYVSERSKTSPWAENLARHIGMEGAAGVYVAVDGLLCGALHLADEIRIDAPRAIRLLRASGVERIVMLTGDRQDVATTIGGLLGVDAVFAAQTPASKLEAITAARASGVSMMVGDGVNDAPALAAADIGVAMGAKGAAAAAESAQIVLLADRLDRLAFAVKLAHRTRAIALQSVMAGMGLSLAAMVVAAFGYLPPVAGAILQEFIDVAVIFNALRVLRLEGTHVKNRIPAQDVEQLKHEHATLLPVIDRVSRLADRLGELPAMEMRTELASLNASLRDELLPHESKDDAQLYPRIAKMIGGEDPMASMSSTHREIHRLSRRLERLAAHLSDQGHDQATTQELRRTLYALDAILRLHFSQEEEIYHGLSS
jgi:heavy metal translocating P-type ATPase